MYENPEEKFMKAGLLGYPRMSTTIQDGQQGILRCNPNPSGTGSEVSSICHHQWDADNGVIPTVDHELP